jgi:hypothetical protein
VRRDVRNWPELVEAVRELEAEIAEPRVIVLHDPGGITFQFVLGEHGLTRIEGERRSNAIYPERFRRSIFGVEDK